MKRKRKQEKEREKKKERERKKERDKGGSKQIDTLTNANSIGLVSLKI